MGVVKISIARKHFEEMRVDVAARYPIEACGLLAGVRGKSLGVFPLRNALESPHRYLADAEEMARALWEIHRRGWQVLAVYHSHPFGGFRPSAADLRFANRQFVHLIWAKKAGKWAVRGWVIFPVS